MLQSGVDKMIGALYIIRTIEAQDLSKPPNARINPPEANATATT